MDAQVETGILQVARCCFRKAQARRRDLGTLGLCAVSQGAAGCPDLISGADRQRNTPANFPQAGEQFWRVGHRLSAEDRPSDGWDVAGYDLQLLARCLWRSISGQSETCCNASVNCRWVSSIIAFLGPSWPWNTPSTPSTWNIKMPRWKPDKPV